MLRILRNKKTAKKIWIGLAIIIIPAFTLWGFTEGLRNRQENVPVGKIFGRNISGIEFKDSLAAVKTIAIMRFGDRLAQVQQYLDLETQAWERLILLAEAKKRHIAASNNEVIEDIENSLYFQSQGYFSNKIYNEILRYSLRIQPRIFEELTRQNIIIAKLYDQITNKTSLSDAQIKKEYAKTNQELSIEYAASLISEFASSIAPTQQQLQDYYQSDKSKFKQPATLNIIYVIVTDEEKAKKLNLLLKKNKGLKTAAKALELETKETGLFDANNAIPGLGFSPELLKMISKLKIGESTPMIKSDKLFYIFELIEKNDVFIPELAKIQDKVKQSFIQETAKNLASQKIKQLQNELKTQDLAIASRKLGLKISTTGLFKYGAAIKELPNTNIFWDVAYDLNVQQPSEIITDSNGFYIIKLRSKSLFDESRYTKEKPDFAKRILLEKKEALFREFIEDLKKKV